MPVFDFNSVPDEEKKNAVCTYETFMSSEESVDATQELENIINFYDEYFEKQRKRKISTCFSYKRCL